MTVSPTFGEPNHFSAGSIFIPSGPEEAQRRSEAYVKRGIKNMDRSWATERGWKPSMSIEEWKTRQQEKLISAAKFHAEGVPEDEAEEPLPEPTRSEIDAEQEVVDAWRRAA